MAIQHILFPTDFSDPSAHAGRYAAALARAAGARVTILNVMLPPYPPGDLAPGEALEVTRKLAQEEEARVHRAIAALTEAGDFRGLPVRERVKTGLVEDGVLQALGEDPADLVVLDRDIDAPDAGPIGDTKVLATMIGGALVFEAPALEA